MGHRTNVLLLIVLSCVITSVVINHELAVGSNTVHSNDERILSPAAVGGIRDHSPNEPKSLGLNSSVAVSTDHDNYDVFHFHTNHSAYCLPNRGRPFGQTKHGWPAKSGLLMVKIEKCASTTAASIQARIAMQLGKRVLLPKYSNNNNNNERRSPNATLFANGAPVCFVRGTSHLWSTRLQEQQCPRLDCIDRARSFLWTLIRHPTKRAVSEFFHFGLSYGKITANTTEELEEEFEKFMNARYLTEYYHSKLLGGTYAKRIALARLDFTEEQLKATFDTFDFIGISERLEDTIVLLGVLMGLEPSDVVHLADTKTAGTSFAYTHSPVDRCYPLLPANLTGRMKMYLESENLWLRRNRYNFALYEAVNRQLDRTIESIRPQFESFRERYREAMALAQATCGEEVVFPCSSNGMLRSQDEQNCLIRPNGDVGCGWPCLDRLFGDGIQ